MARGDEWGYWRFPESVPRPARGGIRAQGKQGRFGESWWAVRWIAVLERFRIGARLRRGRSYARRGQVLDIQVAKGRVTATVQGSRPTPYKVAMQIRPLSQPDWTRVAEVLRRQASFAARLLAGQMPQEIEAAFAEAGRPLFPEALKDLATECSCPDWSNPCKHIAAVYYILGEEFDRDPFLLFTLRGKTRAELLAMLDSEAAPGSARGRRRAGRKQPAPDRGPDTAAAMEAPSEALPLDSSAFWGKVPTEPLPVGEAAPPRAPAALVRRLGSFPFWRGTQSFLEAMQATYRAASAAGLRVLTGEARSESPDGQ